MLITTGPDGAVATIIGGDGCLERAVSGGGVPLILPHDWPGRFLGYVDMLPMLDDFNVVVPFLTSYGFSPRPPELASIAVTCRSAGANS